VAHNDVFGLVPFSHLLNALFYKFTFLIEKKVLPVIMSFKYKLQVIPIRTEGKMKKNLMVCIICVCGLVTCGGEFICVCVCE